MNLRAFAKKELEDYQGAIEDITKAIEINPYSNRSISLEGIRQKKN